jgi:hypothetical protein
LVRNEKAKLLDSRGAQANLRRPTTGVNFASLKIQSRTKALMPSLFQACAPSRNEASRVLKVMLEKQSILWLTLKSLTPPRRNRKTTNFDLFVGLLVPILPPVSGRIRNLKTVGDG